MNCQIRVFRVVFTIMASAFYQDLVFQVSKFIFLLPELVFCFLVDFVELMVRAVSFLRPELHACPAVTAQDMKQGSREDNMLVTSLDSG